MGDEGRRPPVGWRTRAVWFALGVLAMCVWVVWKETGSLWGFGR